ncbi:DnaJ C-terminal domain-containing protein [Pseudaquabacterium terrae]|uniref:DnaJ C-terminal domain-containing protein n=1 Tax=Pseudaquabacterium terrae TaxID=2732868 RepID=UPI001C256472|nr:DnaJ C-terminal domain-containing protein [Aquabacterium terrae]
MSTDDAYVELGLAPGASESEVKAAWRRLVSRWHPDRNRSPDAAARMQRVNGAYERIRLAVGIDAPADTGAAGSGRTVRQRVRLSLEDAALGCTRVLRGRLVDDCSDCRGLGTLVQRMPCTTCAGSGQVRESLWFGWLSAQARCSACDGSGHLNPPCPACAGAGRRASRYRRTVRFPAGLRQGDVLNAEGAAGQQGGFDGTLELHVEVSAHPFFVVGDDGTLRCEMPVDGFAWIAETWVDVPTLEGLQQIRLRRGRHVYRLRGQGLPLERGDGERGDYVVTIAPVFAEAPSPRQRALLEQLAEAAAAAPAEAARDWHTTLQAWDRQRRRDGAA